ncbi:hypothetical protein GCM10010178_24780 [Lentzea flava]|uniref:Ig-like domain-containing protein n=1 Tax=Lentzea flava TaxID=103732 RepID=A0ABQ2UG79_9PSEU|nr:hypothetical protein GCM10010178_24780 [Lentzea flava]
MIGTQSSPNNASCAAVSCSADTARVTSDPTVATGAPVVSAMAISIELSPVVHSRTRSAVAPTACSATFSHENGTAPSVRWSANATACSAASSNAGWSPKPAVVTSSGSATSANTWSPSFQAARSPWNACPYSNPTSANRS